MYIYKGTITFLMLSILTLLSVVITDNSISLTLLFLELTIIFIPVMRDIYNPLFLLIGFSFSLIISYLYLTNIDDLNQIKYHFDGINDIDLFESINFIIQCYFFLWCGFYFLKKEQFAQSDKRNFIKTADTPNILLYIVFALLFIAIANLLRNLYIVYSNNLNLFGFNYLMLYFKENSITTIGYTFFLPLAVYIYRYYLLSIKKPIDKFYIFLIVFTICSKVLTGRITSTLFLLLMYIMIELFLQQKKKIVLKVYLLLIFIVIGAILFYYVRTNIEGKTLTIFINSFGFYIIRNGNIPNIPILMYIMDRYDGVNFSYLHGATLLNGNSEMIMRENLDQYLMSGVGNLPPTMFGEFYMNFGRIGTYISMFTVGCILKILYNILLKSRNYFYIVIYFNIFIVGGFATLAKMDTSGLHPIILYKIPIFILLALFLKLYKQFCVIYFKSLTR